MNMVIRQKLKEKNTGWNKKTKI